MRIFVGIKLSEKLRERVLEWENKHRFNPSAPRLHSGHLPSSGEQDNGARWMAPKNLHVTLVPPWEVSRETWNAQHGALKQKLRAIKFQSFEIRFNKIEYGPDLRQPRLIWAGGQANDEIKNLRLNIHRALNTVPDGHPFRMHCTLARLNNAGEFARYNIKLPQIVNWRQEVPSFCLYESRLSPEGADYEALEQFRI